MTRERFLIETIKNTLLESPLVENIEEKINTILVNNNIVCTVRDNTVTVFTMNNLIRPVTIMEENPADLGIKVRKIVEAIIHFYKRSDDIQKIVETLKKQGFSVQIEPTTDGLTIIAEYRQFFPNNTDYAMINVLKQFYSCKDRYPPEYKGYEKKGNGYRIKYYQKHSLEDDEKIVKIILSPTSEWELNEIGKSIPGYDEFNPFLPMRELFQRYLSLPND